MLVDLLRSYLQTGRNHRILDIGCGGGLFFAELEQFGEVEGIEVDAGMKTGLESVDSRIHWGPLETFRTSHRFSAVLMLDVLEHLQRPVDAVRMARDLLEPGGVLIVTVPAFPMLWTSHDVINEHVVRYTCRTLASVARDAGAKPERLRYFFHWLFPVKLMVRLLERLSPRRADASPIPRTPPAPVNSACFLLSRMEQASFRAISLPLGSSLLMVAR